jgi:hypothetical protein
MMPALARGVGKYRQARARRTSFGTSVASVIVFTSAVAWAGESRAEAPPPKPDFVPEGEYFPRGTWAAGFAAKVESSSYEGRDPRTPTMRSSRYGISSRNGYFVANRFLVGLRASYDVALHRTTLPGGDGGRVLESEGTEQSFEIGPWFRYYFPVGNGWAFFADADWGYRTFYDEEKAIGKKGQASESSGRGLGIGLGGGLTYFLTKGVAFDVAGRVSFARLISKEEGRKTRVDLSDFGLVLGFQVYLPEFVF